DVDVYPWLHPFLLVSYYTNLGNMKLIFHDGQHTMAIREGEPCPRDITSVEIVQLRLNTR
ncbi:MAG: hypothetical protein D6820_16640, partial [Lentisphaerae bacterium]